MMNGGNGPSPQAKRGRGALSNRSGRFESEVRERFHDGWEQVEEQTLRTSVTEETARTIITRNTSPDLGFDRSINPYRGCEHGCVYCFARPTHAYLGLSAGLDFETRLFVKPDAPALLTAELSKQGYRPRSIAIGTNTDPYQPLERKRRIMRGVLKVLEEFRHPVGIVTKGGLVTRDKDILGRMGRAGLARVFLSVTSLDNRLSRSMEPRASAPSRRLKAVAELAEAGCPTGVMVAPVIPAINDHEIENILDAASRAGAGYAGFVVLRLPLEVRDLFREWLENARPDRAERVMRCVRELHGGLDYNPAFGERLSGKGVLAALISRRFDVACKRFGLRRKSSPLRTDLFRAPSGSPPLQGDLFDSTESAAPTRA